MVHHVKLDGGAGEESVLWKPSWRKLMANGGLGSREYRQYFELVVNCGTGHMWWVWQCWRTWTVPQTSLWLCSTFWLRFCRSKIFWLWGPLSLLCCEYQRLLSSKLKWLRHDTYHWLLCSVEEKNEWSCTSIPSYAFMACTGTTLLFICLNFIQPEFVILTLPKIFLANTVMWNCKTAVHFRGIVVSCLYIRVLSSTAHHLLTQAEPTGIYPSPSCM